MRGQGEVSRLGSVAGPLGLPGRGLLPLPWDEDAAADDQRIDELTTRVTTGGQLIEHGPRRPHGFRTQAEARVALFLYTEGRISFARRLSRFSRSKPVSRVRSSVARPWRWPAWGQLRGRE